MLRNMFNNLQLKYYNYITFSGQIDQIYEY